MIREELKEIEGTPKNIRGFAIVIGVFLVVVGYIFFRSYVYFFAAAGVAVIVAGFIKPVMLSLPYKIWMGSALVIGFIISRIILVVLFYIIITPISIIYRVAGKEFLRAGLENSQSYWVARDQSKAERDDYKRQF